MKVHKNGKGPYSLKFQYEYTKTSENDFIGQFYVFQLLSRYGLQQKDAVYFNFMPNINDAFAGNDELMYLWLNRFVQKQ